MASGYDVTIKLYQHHMKERVRMPWMLLMYLMYFVVFAVMLLAKYSGQLHYHVSDLLTSGCVRSL